MRPIPAFGVLFACLAVPAAAQTAVTAPVSLGGDVGIFAPFESGSSGSLTGRFIADVYAWDRLGLRFAAGLANPDLGDRPFGGRATMVYATGGLIQRLNGSVYNPYLHGGVGIYRFSGDNSQTDLGLNFGAGFELQSPIRRTFLTPELTAYVISGDGPRFALALTIGVHTKPR
ncbi:MAG TPA: hypothetical protein VMT19_07645 [Thermoanaerobaculaceae bacterium]|nr:hypothetical protein [Thermoanaerobaculaceae bacterium]